jgi:transcriptional regulator with XRE-family HTH domain
MSRVEDDDHGSDLRRRIAARVRQLRAERAESLDSLAARSGVSRSAISLIERAESSPTAVVLERLATALDVPLASLFDAPARSDRADRVARRRAQAHWRDPASGYVRRNVTSPTWPSPITIVEVEFPAGASVSYETSERAVPIHQQVWVLAGRIEITFGDDTYELAAGDCFAMQLDRPMAYRNRTERPARYAVVLVAEPAPARRHS